MSRIRSQLAFGDLTGGLNTTYNKENINSTPKKTETPDMVNVEYFKLGGIQTMKGNRKVGENNLSIQDSAVIAGWEYTKGNKRYMVIGLENGDVRLYDQSLDREDSEENPFKLIYKFPSSSSRMSFCNMNNGVVISNGIDDLAFFDIGTEKSLLGSVSFAEGNDIINGVDTFFTNELKVGQTVKINGCKNVYVVKEIISDTSIRVEPNIVLDDYRTYYEWDGSSTKHTVEMSTPDLSVREKTYYMPDVVDIYDLEEGQHIEHTIKHFVGDSNFCAHNDIRPKYIIQSGRICRVNYDNVATSFINDNPASPANNCKAITNKDYFIDNNNILYLLKENNDIINISLDVIELYDKYVLKDDGNLYIINEDSLELIDSNCVKLFPSYDDDIIFYIKEETVNDNTSYVLYYYKVDGFDYVEDTTGPVIYNGNNLTITDYANTKVTGGIIRNSNRYTFPIVISDGDVRYIRLYKEVDGPDGYASVTAFDTNETTNQTYNNCSGCIGYSVEYTDGELSSKKFYSSIFQIRSGVSPTYTYTTKLVFILNSTEELNDGYVNIDAYVSGLGQSLNEELVGQIYIDFVSNKRGCAYSSGLDIDNRLHLKLQTISGGASSDTTHPTSTTIDAVYADTFTRIKTSQRIYIEALTDNTLQFDEILCFMYNNSTFINLEKNIFTRYFDNYNDLYRYIQGTMISGIQFKYLNCTQDALYYFDGEYIDPSTTTPSEYHYYNIPYSYNNTNLNAMNLSIEDTSSSVSVVTPFEIKYTIHNSISNIYTIDKSRYAEFLYSEPNENSLKSNPHEPYSTSQILVYGNETDPTSKYNGVYYTVTNVAERGIYTYDPLNQVKVYNEEPYTDGAAIYISDVQMLNAYITNSDPDVATGLDINVPVRGLALQHYQGRLWVGGETGLFYSAVGLPNNWDIYSDAGVIYDIYNDSSSVKALGLFSEYLIVHKEFSTYILTCSDLGSTIEIKPFSNITCESQQSWIVSNTKYYVYSKDFMDIYPLVQHTVFNDKFLGEPITQKVRDIFHNLRNGDTDKIFCVSRPLSRQMIFYLPTINRSGSGEAIIFDFQTKSFLFRRLPKDTEVTIAFNYNNDIYIGTRDGLVLKEFTGDSFTVLKDGVVEERGLEAYYKSPWFDWIGGYTQSFAEFFVELDNEHKNNFWIRTQKDGQSRYEDRKIDLDKINRSKKYLIWAGDEEPKDSKWNEKYWEKKRFENIRMLLPNNVFEDFQVEFRAIDKGEHFCIYQYGFRRIETEEDPW